MVNSSMKRILIDIVDLKKDPLEDAYLSFDEENLYDVYLLIIGSEGCPYEGGFYMFKITFTDRYPIEPPKVKFLTTHEKVRVNPNMYENGKVCLSILGTWAGPSWTSVMTLRSLILSLQSLLSENPLRNEPGYENELSTSQRNISYNMIVNFFNWSHAIIEMIKNPVHEGFRETIKKEYIARYDKYVQMFKMKENFEPTLVKAMYGMRMMVDYSTLKLPTPIEITHPMNSV